jgi:hydrogenase/urease accessory protein HupE
MRYHRSAALLVLLTLCTPAAAAAHALGQSYVFLRVYHDSIEARVEMTVDDLARVLGLGWRSGAGVTREEVGAHLDRILGYVRPRLYVGTEAGEMPLRFAGFDVRHIEIADYVLLRFVIDDLASLPERLEVGYSVLLEEDPRHRNLLVIEHNWRTNTFDDESNIALIFGPSAPRQTLDLSSSSVLRGFVGFVRLGVWHIWIGLDHILFLVALLLPSVLVRRPTYWEAVPSFRPALLNVLAIVTCFTIAHSITLSLAALQIVRLPERPVEVIIAASIAAAALYNLYPRVAVREWMIAFVFGLFHGFGFANVLTGLDLEPRYLALSLLGFNLGVEAGQIAIICLIFPALFLLRTRPAYTPMLRYASLLLIAVAGFWIVERALDLPLSAYAVRAPRYLVRRVLAVI